jgi:RNA polymerase sigma factor (sigma-70 family)
MARRPLDTLLRNLRSAARPAAGDSTDAQLLERFVRGRDEAAFELLVRRHGRMVLNVCRRVLHREHDAEDAFQATFLVLARKAGGIGNGASVGGWLYKVAYRVALRARAAARARPLAGEALPDAAAAEPVLGLLGGELRAALDEEIDRLPERYRAALVLCLLEGQTTEAAARALRRPPGTVGTWVARARALLRRRLARRGFDLSAVALAPGGAAALPAALADAAVRAAAPETVGQAVAAGLVSAHVADLTRGALPALSPARWVLATAVVLALGLLGGAATLACRAQAVEQPAPDAPAGESSPGVLLRLHFHQGRPFYQEVTTATRQSMKVMGSDVTQDQRQTFTFRWTPEEQRPDGTWVLTQRVEGLRMDLDVGGSKISYDSTRGGTASSALGNLYKALVGAEFRVTLDRKYRVLTVAGRDEFLDKASRASPALGPLRSQLFSAEDLRRVAQVAFPALPAERVEPGDSWARKSRVDLGNLGSYEATSTYTYEGREGSLDRISVECTLKFRGPATDLPFRVKEADLDHASGTGTILFDRARGRVVRQELNLKLGGRLTYTSGGQDVGVVLVQTQKITVRTTDTNPLRQTEPPADTREELQQLRQENAELKRRLKKVEEALRPADKPRQ